MKNFKKLIKEAHLGNPLNEEDSDDSLYDRRQKAIDAVFGQDEEYPEFDINDVRADLDEEIDDEDIVIYDGEEHIIMSRDGNMIYIRPLEDSAILGKRDVIKVPARALAYKSDLDKMYDEYKPKDELDENEKYDHIARAEYGKPWTLLSIAQKQEMLSVMNRETEKEFETDFERRRKGDYSDDMEDGMTDYERSRMDEDMNDPVLIKARAAQMADEKEMARQAALDKKYGPTFMDKLDAELDLKAELQDLKDEREQLMIDMEQEAEPEGGEIADEYGSRLNDIDARMDEIKPELEDLRMYESVDEGTCGYGEDGVIGDEPAGPDLNEDEIPMYLTSNDAFRKAVEDSVSYNDFEKRVYGILGNKYFKLAKIENPDAFKDFYDSIRGNKPKMEEAFDLDIDDAHSGDAALDKTVGDMGYNESLNKSLKEALNKRLGK